jgi:hypothetical protein
MPLTEEEEQILDHIQCCLALQAAFPYVEHDDLAFLSLAEEDQPDATPVFSAFPQTQRSNPLAAEEEPFIPPFADIPHLYGPCDTCGAMIGDVDPQEPFFW